VNKVQVAQTTVFEFTSNNRSENTIQFDIPAGATGGSATLVFSFD
jgi:hypothetical protein